METKSVAKANTKSGKRRPATKLAGDVRPSDAQEPSARPVRCSELMAKYIELAGAERSHAVTLQCELDELIKNDDQFRELSSLEQFLLQKMHLGLARYISILSDVQNTIWRKG